MLDTFIAMENNSHLDGLTAALFSMRKLSGEEHMNEEAVLFCTIMAVVCVCTAGLMSGLTIGLLSIDSVDLEVRGRHLCVLQKGIYGRTERGMTIMQVLKRCGTDREKKVAAGIESVRCSLVMDPPCILLCFYISTPCLWLAADL